MEAAQEDRDSRQAWSHGPPTVCARRCADHALTHRPLPADSGFRYVWVWASCRSPDACLTPIWHLLEIELTPVSCLSDMLLHGRRLRFPAHHARAACSTRGQPRCADSRGDQESCVCYVTVCKAVQIAAEVIMNRNGLISSDDDGRLRVLYHPFLTITIFSTVESVCMSTMQVTRNLGGHSTQVNGRVAMLSDEVRRLRRDTEQVPPSIWHISDAYLTLSIHRT